MVVDNTLSKKKSEKMITLKSSGNSSMIDFVVVKNEVMNRARDVKVIPDEKHFSQHKLLAMDFVLENKFIQTKSSEKQIEK